jgi:hypothetical protein
MEDQSVCGLIMAMLLSKRVESAVEVQKILTQYGCSIRMRLGLHEASKDYCAEEGLIVLHVCGSEEEAAGLERELSSLEGVRVKTLELKDL